MRERGITELRLHALNAILAPQGYVIHAAKGRDRTRFVACLDEEGRKEAYGLFELQHVREEGTR